MRRIKPATKAIEIERTVATAAPLIPHPNPLILVPGITSNIISGSAIILTIAVIMRSFIGVLASPVVLKMVFIEYEEKNMGRKRTLISPYSIPYLITSESVVKKVKRLFRERLKRRAPPIANTNLKVIVWAAMREVRSLLSDP